MEFLLGLEVSVLRTVVTAAEVHRSLGIEARATDSS